VKKKPSISCVFLDLGGVLLTNGWDHLARRRAARYFKLDWKEMESRHKLFMSPCELGLIGLEEYLNRVIFFKPRLFTTSRFRQFMLAQSKPHSDMIQLLRGLKADHGLKVIVVNNEGRELNEYRIKRYGLTDWIDLFLSSCFVHLQKPDRNIYRLVLDAAQVSPDRVVYIENTFEFTQVAESFGIKSILHKHYRSTRAQLASLGLPVLDGVVYE
jgi:putative hydrolase of the HAD superfamily